ncbi:MAG: AraC family transcriptional regulator, partial [Methanobacterium sp.]|nr:AraC family transcriptional regulator [Methanobacterium sp.]
FKNGYEIAGPPMEFYLNDPREVPESEILTEVRQPVVKK